MDYYFFMPAAYFRKYYPEYLSSIVFHNDHINGIDKVIKVCGIKYRKYLLQFTANQPCPQLKELTKEEAESQITQPQS